MSDEKREYYEGHLRKARALCEAVRVTLKEQSDENLQRGIVFRACERA